MADPDRSCHYDVCVVGLGPVGATLANLLGGLGVSTLVLEREPAAYHLPRAVHFDDEVMRVFQTIGLAETILPYTHVSPGSHFVDATGGLLMAWPRSPDIGPQGWHVSYRFHQPDLERILREAIGRYRTVAVRPNCEVTGIVQDANGAQLFVTDQATNQTGSYRARYVVGCDGGRSLVRRVIGGEPDDLGFRERWLVLDVILRRPRPDLGDFTVQFCNPARPATYVRGTGDRRRWEIALLPHEDANEMETPDQVWRLLAPWLTPRDAELERAACYTFHSIVASRWRDRRLLIAGDAAHLTPPFLGQGMCAGIRDVANLAWKLGRVVRGLDEPSLLDTYQTERAPHVREYIEMAVRLGGLINTSAAEAALAVGARDTESAPLRMESIKPRLGPGLTAGWDAPARQVAPQPALSDGTRLDDRTGYRPALVLRDDIVLSRAQTEHLDRRDVAVVTDNAASVSAWLAAEDVVAIVVRPDRYVLGAARTKADVAALVAAL